MDMISKKIISDPIRHPRVGGGPLGLNPDVVRPWAEWIPASAGMTVLIIASFLLLPLLLHSQQTEVEHKPVSIAALQEMGMLKSGVVGGDVLEEMEDEWVDHFGAFVNKEIVINNRLHLYGGLGGVFQFRKPELVAANVDGHQRRAFFIGPTHTEAEYHFGEIEKPWLKLGMGMFGYKYNPDAVNLGEYLFRAGPYPNYIMTGGYVVIGNAVGYLQGLKGRFDLGDFKLDLLATTETSLAPLYDFSLAGISSYSLMDGFLTLGAGVNFKRLISVDKEKTSRETRVNGYIEHNGVYYSTFSNYYNEQGNFLKTRFSETGNLQDSLDSEQFFATKSLVDSIIIADSAKIEYYPGGGALLMGRLSLDPKVLMESELFGPEDLKIFSEIAVLGLKNYPVFYTKRDERMPVMFGINLPAFKFLDLISLQFEYYKSSQLNNTFAIGNNGSNTPFIPSASDPVASTNRYMDVSEQDDIKWSLLVQKSLLGNINFSFQVARDHIRMTSSELFYGPQFAPNEYTLREKDWYWMTQISWGI